MQEKLEERFEQYKKENDVLVREMVRHLQHWECSFNTMVSHLCDHMQVAFSQLGLLSYHPSVCKVGPTGI